MAKRKITVNIDEEVLAKVRELGDAHLSAVMNAALAERVDRLARRDALRDLLHGWDQAVGPVGDDDTRDAAAAFDELEGIGFGGEIA
ncbi:type II toxin-antitoxin system CcdA family antitoxin [Nocardia carnea]|uniref:Type II toxin-antitoxin system CcdA family antitoxin n=1 Tax=Nocardia carnea TaxID=37328 RepID=A0ABW7TIJ5_9NOCA|nr:type II toxin-antitoxin system CcdA family antitoxin [Nocardia carnea]